MKGLLYGIGVGPGDPELMTLKAIKAIAACDVIAAPYSGADNQTAISIAHEYIGEKPVMLLDLPMTRDKAELSNKRALAADVICDKLALGKNVGFLTLGDPLVYSTYSYLHKIIISRGYTVKTIPAVTSFCAAAAALEYPLCESGEALHIIPALYADLENALMLDGTKVLMKSGTKLNDAITMIKEKKLQARVAQRVGMDGERLLNDISAGVDSDYFSIIIVKGESEGL